VWRLRDTVAFFLSCELGLSMKPLAHGASVRGVNAASRAFAEAGHGCAFDWCLQKQRCMGSAFFLSSSAHPKGGVGQGLQGVSMPPKTHACTHAQLCMHTNTTLYTGSLPRLRPHSCAITQGGTCTQNTHFRACVHTHMELQGRAQIAHVPGTSLYRKVTSSTAPSAAASSDAAVLPCACSSPAARGPDTAHAMCMMATCGSWACSLDRWW